MRVVLSLWGDDFYPSAPALKKSFRLKTKPGTLLENSSESLKQNPAVCRGKNDSVGYTFHLEVKTQPDGF